MKKVIVAIGLVFISTLFTINASAYPVKLISSDYAVGGDCSVIGGDSDSYSLTSRYPISGGPSCSGAYSINFAGFFSVSSQSQGYLGSASGEASATWVFSPLVSFSGLTINYGVYSEGSYSYIDAMLTDLSTGQLVGGYSQGGSEMNDWGMEIVNYDFQSKHPYRLSFRTFTSDSAFFGPCGSLSTYDLTPVSSVPEPSTLLLLGAGLSGVAIMRRKLRK